MLPVFFGRRVFKQPLYLRKWQFCFYIVFLFPPLAVTLPHRFLLPVSLSARLFTEPICRRRVLINHTAIYTVRVAFPRRFECTRQPCKFIKMLIWTQIKVAINIRQFPVRTSDLSISFLHFSLCPLTMGVWEETDFPLGCCCHHCQRWEGDTETAGVRIGVWEFSLNVNSFWKRKRCPGFSGE